MINVATHPVQLLLCSCRCSADKLSSSSVNLVDGGSTDNYLCLKLFIIVVIVIVTLITFHLSPLLLLLLNLFKAPLPGGHLYNTPQFTC